MLRCKGLAAATSRATVMASLVVLAACSKPGSGTAASPSATPSVRQTVATPTSTVTVTPTPSPSPTPTKSPTSRPRVTATATPSVTPTVQIAPGQTSTTIKPGGFISLTLGEATDGGFQWVFQTRPSAAVLAVVSDQSLGPATSPPTGTVGASGRHRWVFQGVAPGTTSFTVVEQGPGSGPITSTYSHTVVVSP